MPTGPAARREVRYKFLALVRRLWRAVPRLLPTTPSSAPAWLQVQAPPSSPRHLWLLGGALLFFAAVLWWVVPHGIGFSWRECDTQSIARNLLEDRFDVLHPRVDWRGTTDGSVECEFPLYQLGIALLLAVFGDVEWPGRLISLAAVVYAASSLYRLLRRRGSEQSAFAGVLAFLATGSAALLATRVQPDALCLAFGLRGMVAFVDYLGGGRGRHLVLATLLLALAGLLKPLALQLGLLAFGWTLLLMPRRLGEGRLWVSFVVIVGVVVLWLWHAYQLWLQTGLSFGVIGGGDSKFPGAAALSPAVWGQLVWTTLQYGLSPVGAVAVSLLLLRRRFDKGDAILTIAVLTGLVVSLRYSCFHGLGPHYHMWAAAASGWFVARALPERAGRRWWLPFLVLTAACAAWRLHEERGMRIVVNQTPWQHVAEQLRSGTKPTELLLVHGEMPRYDPVWHTGHNFEDPRMLYQTRRRGFALANDGWSPAVLEQLRRSGATVVVDMHPEGMPPQVESWLAKHATLWLRHGGLVLYRLHAND